jgi:SAM-dependent methyltransferase
LKLYEEIADWWPLFSAPEDYAAEAEFFRRLFEQSCQPAPPTMLELGSGGGNNAVHLRAHFEMTLVDLSAQMLLISRALNPGCEHIVGDMRTLRLGRVFDAVFVHDAIVYMTTEAHLCTAILTAYEHCRVGGVAIFVPDFVRETFVARTTHGGHDGAGRSVRYLEWTFDPDPNDSTYVTDYAIMMRDALGGVHVEHDRHVAGLFARSEWLRLLGEVGFNVRMVEDQWSRNVFVGVREH